jgi:hypothetical protein
VTFQNFTSENNGSPQPRPTSTPTPRLTPPSEPPPSCPPLPFSQRPTAAPSTPNEPPRSHFLNNGSDYRYADQNCHTSANAGARGDHRNTGIVSCRPDQSLDFQVEGLGRGGHTYNWKASPPDRCGTVQVCLYNWGEGYCYLTRSYTEGSAPDLYESGAAASIMRRFCGDQFIMGTSRALSPGSLVEDAGWLRCVKEASGGNANDPIGILDLTPSDTKLRDCQRCCDRTVRTVLDNWRQGLACEAYQRVNSETQAFAEKCSQECKKYLAPTPTPTPSPTQTPTPSPTPARRR